MRLPRFPLWIVLTVGFAALFKLVAPAGLADQARVVLATVPLPRSADEPAASHPLAGTWAGMIDEHTPTVLTIEDADVAGSVTALWAEGGVASGWTSVEGARTDTRLWLHVGGTEWWGEISAQTGTLRLNANDGYRRGIFHRTSLTQLRREGDEHAFHGGERLLLEGPDGTELVTLIYRPSGEGPFPLVVLHHGATDSGTDPAADRVVWTSPSLVERFRDAGYLVAVPQRRGRGGSTGTYAEGLTEDRRDGYSCAPDVALAGFAHALADLDAVMPQLLRRADVVEAPALLVGNSRGGALAHAWAGAHPEDVAGVISFAAGWVPQDCPDAVTINRTTLATEFDGPILRLYGSEDALYADPHLAAIYEGGATPYTQLNMPWHGDGHRLISFEPVWRGAIAGFLAALD